MRHYLKCSIVVTHSGLKGKKTKLLTIKLHKNSAIHLRHPIKLRAVFSTKLKRKKTRAVKPHIHRHRLLHQADLFSWAFNLYLTWQAALQEELQLWCSGRLSKKTQRNQAHTLRKKKTLNLRLSTTKIISQAKVVRNHLGALKIKINRSIRIKNTLILQR